MRDIINDLADIKDTLDEHVHVNTSPIEEALDALEQDHPLSGDELDTIADQIDDAETNVTSLIESLMHDRDRLIQAREEVRQLSVEAYEREDELENSEMYELSRTGLTG